MADDMNIYVDIDNIRVVQGPQGEDGADGTSSTVEVEEIPGGIRVTVTDVDGEHSADLLTRVAYATYGYTRSAEIEEAYQNGQVVFCRYGGDTYRLIRRRNAYDFIFGRVYQDEFQQLTCFSDEWSAETVALARESEIPVESVDGKTGAVTILPTGGSAGQVLAKTGAADYAVGWVDQSGGSGGDSVFIATYGTTSVSDIEAAYQAGKAIYCIRGTQILAHVARTSATNHSFGCVTGLEETKATCSSSGWSVTTSYYADANQGIPAGGLEGQVLAKASDYDNDTEWVDPPSAAEVFFATYGTTTSAEIEAAYQAGKIVVCDNSGDIYLLTVRVGAANHVFSFISANTSYQARCVSDAWSSSSIALNTATAYSSTPAALGTASAGSSTQFSRGDHVHAMPDADDVGAIPAPSSPTSGQFLVYDGSAWTAMTLAAWSGGSY